MKFDSKITFEILNILSDTGIIQLVWGGGSRTARTSKMERFVIIVNAWKPLTMTKRSILDVAAVQDPPLVCTQNFPKN